MPGVTLLGLGPGNPQHLTREAAELLSAIPEIWVRTRRHPTVAALPPSIAVYSFDDLYESAGSFDEVYAVITENVLQLARRAEGVVYGVPGHPFIAESTSPQIAKLAREEGLRVRVVDGLSFLGPTFSALGLDPLPKLTLCDAMTLGAAHVPTFAPDAPALIAQIYSKMVASEVKSTLDEIYPDEHRIRLVHAAGTEAQMVEDLALYEIDRSQNIGALTSLYLPPLGEGTSLEALQEVVARLRAPEGCPWDREQTHASLRQHLLEETYEVLSAIDSADFSAMREEFGDLLLQVMLNAQIAAEERQFTINDVMQNIHHKIIRRHPHVFGDVKVDGVEAVLANWEKLKEHERKSTGRQEGLLAGVPATLPSLSQAQEYQERAARVGFDWPNVRGVLDKIVEEVHEVKGAAETEQLAAEMGDLFFALVNLARWRNIDAESAVRTANLKFRERFAYIERGARQQKRAISDLSLDEMESLWQRAKRERS